MTLRKICVLAACGLSFLSAVFAFQRPFREFPGVEYDLGDIPLPPDYQEKTEFAFARLMFPPGPLNGYYGRDWEWHRGNSLWTQDFPRADRHFLMAVRRLTRIHVRSVEQVVNLDEGDAYDWPWLYAVQVGEWGITQHEADVLRDYLLRGGFFMADDFHGAYEWEMFEKRMKMVFPDRPIVDIPDNDAIFHTLFDLDDRPQIPGAAHLRRGYKVPDYAQGPEDGKGAHWRGIYDDKGRIMVAICFNSDVGDSWEWTDRPEYPEKFSSAGVRVGINYLIYAMTH